METCSRVAMAIDTKFRPQRAARRVYFIEKYALPLTFIFISALNRRLSANLIISIRTYRPAIAILSHFVYSSQWCCRQAPHIIIILVNAVEQQKKRKKVNKKFQTHCWRQ